MTATHVPWRDLDFRYLLPMADLGRVHAPEGLHDQLRQIGAEPVSRAESVVIEGASVAQLVEFNRSGRSLPRQRRIAPGVERRTYWCRGEAGSWPISWVPMRDSSAARYLQRQTSGGGVKQRLTRALAGTGSVRWAVPRSATVTGPSPRPFVERQLAGYVPEVTSSVLLTPTFPTSRHVVLLGLDVAGAVQAIAKFARAPGDTTQLRQEAAALGALAEHRARHLGPALLGDVLTCGSEGIVCEGVEGRPLSVLPSQRDVVTVTSRFCADLPTTSGADAAAYLPMVEASMQALADSFPQHQASLARTREAVARLRERPVASVLEHGDVAHHNVLVAAGHRAKAIDWENGQIHGMPGHDLAFALEYATSLETQADDDATRARAYSAAISPGGWAAAELEEHLLSRGVERAQHADLLVLSWARRALGALRRSGSAAVAAHHRDVTIWQELTR